MMNQSAWERLREAFEEEEPFWEGNYADESEFKELNLYRWLECHETGGVRPSTNIIKEFSDHGYRVYPVEKDSFGWLIGGVCRKDNPIKTITFG